MTYANSSTLARPRVLVIDDILENIEMLVHALSREYEVQFASSGSEGLALVAQRLPDLILLDIMMPDMDGFEVCQRLQADTATCEIPVIFVTARNDFESETRALACGAVDFIPKPINLQVMLARVRTHVKLRQRESALGQLVQERTQALQVALAQADSANQTKDHFMAIMSHELRTPLVGILNISEAIQAGVYGQLDPGMQHSVDLIEQSGMRLLKVINEYSDVAQLASGQITLDIQPYDLKSICQTSLRRIAEAAERKRHQVHFQMQPEQVICRSDPRRLIQILVNLLDNAIKFMAEGGNLGLEVSASAEQACIRITVWDRGIGIAEHDRAWLFLPFHQLDTRLSRNYEGMGLGLNIAKYLAEQHGGHIDVESVSEQGSRFTVVLPWQPVDEEDYVV